MPISMPEQDIMLCELLSEFPQHVLPLPCNGCISVTSLWCDQRVIDTTVRQLCIHLCACVKTKDKQYGCRVIQ